MKKLFFWCFCVILAGMLFRRYFAAKEMRVLTLGQQELRVEVVRTPDTMAKGLGGRETIGSDGMVFVYPQAQPVVFWMKDMLMPIDILWCLEGKVVGYVENVQPPQNQEANQDTRLPRIASQQPVDLVIELPAGTIKKQQMMVGHQVILGDQI